MLLGETVYTSKIRTNQKFCLLCQTQVFLVLDGAKIGNTYLSDSLGHYSLYYIPLKSSATKP